MVLSSLPVVSVDLFLSVCLSILWTESVLVREMPRIKQKLTGNKQIRLNADDDDHDNLVVD